MLSAVLRDISKLGPTKQEELMTCEVEASNISDWVAIGVALLAFGAAIWQACESRKQAAIAREHNKMSVLPILVHHEGWHNTPDGLVVSLTVKNVGVGVALITDRFFTVEGERFSPERKSSTVEELVDRIFKRTLQYKIITTEFFGPAARIPPGASFTIVKLLFPNAHPNLREVVEAMTSKVSFDVSYESVYKESFKFSTSD